MQIFYKTNNGKTVILEINPEKTMQQITEKIQNKRGITLCNVSLIKIDTRSHCGNFSLQEFLFEDISEEVNICLLSPSEDYINETKMESTEIEEPAPPTTNISVEDKLKQMKDELLCTLQPELKNMLALNKIDTDVNNEISYKKHLEVLHEQLDCLKSEIIKKSKIICNLTSAMNKIICNLTPLQGSKSPWLSSAKANELIDHSTSTPLLCLDANPLKLNFLKKPWCNEENYINLLHFDELLNSGNI